MVVDTLLHRKSLLRRNSGVCRSLMFVTVVAALVAFVDVVAVAITVVTLAVTVVVVIAVAGGAVGYSF